MTVEEIKQKIEELVKERESLRVEALDLVEKDDLEGARAKRTEIKKLDEEISKLEEELEEAEENSEEESEGGQGVPENRSMNFLPDVEMKETESAEVREFRQYIEKREITNGGSLTTEDGFVVIPEEIITDVLKFKEDKYNLDQFVTVKQVANGSGKYPVIRDTSVEALPTVEELEENPELAVKPFIQLEYDIKTHRGYFRVSRELLEDAKINVLEELKTWIANTITATRNKAITDALLNGSAGVDGPTTLIQSQTISDIDGLKDAVNLNIEPNYENNVAIMSRTAYAELDKLKDSSGSYLIQPDVTNPTVKRLLGARIEVIADEALGAEGNQTIIIGNLKDAIVLFDRSRYQAGWTDYMHFGEALMVALRQDVRILNPDAAMLLTFNDTPAG